MKYGTGTDAYSTAPDSKQRVVVRSYWKLTFRVMEVQQEQNTVVDIGNEISKIPMNERSARESSGYPVPYLPMENYV